MNLHKYLIDNKKEIIERWFSAIVGSYPDKTGKYYKQKHKQFTNPVGHTISKEINIIYNEIVNPGQPEIIEHAMENIIKIRAVQDFSAAGACNFVFALKDIVRESTQNITKDKADYEELQGFEDRVDKAMLAAFDCYMRSRERLYEIKATELRNRSHMMIDRLNRKYEYLDKRLDEEDEQNT